MLNLFWTLVALELGSFANACIYRWPRGISVNWPRRSFCPWCKTQIKWIHNIPLLSYLWLKGRCAKCQCPISISYPINEALLPLLFLSFLLAGKFQVGLFAPALLWFGFVLVVTTQVDIEWKIVPDQASFSAMAVGLLFSFVNPIFGEELLWDERLMMSAVGLISGGGLLLIFSWGGEKLLGKDVMGMGDVKLLAGYGAFLGWQGVLATFMLGCIYASVLSIYFIATKSLKRNRYIPFAPFLNAGAATAMILLLNDPRNISMNLFGEGFPISFF